MTPPSLAAGAPLPCIARPAARTPEVPRYLQQAYWWAYVHPNAVRVFEREWLVNLILFGNYGRLRDAALAELGETVSGRTLQVACVYGTLTPLLRQRLAPDAHLDVVDILPVQLKNLAAKMPADERVRLVQCDSSSLACADASYDQVLVFFLLHEQPEHVRRKTLTEALRAAKPGGKIVIMDYHRPAKWHLLRPLLAFVFRYLEPYAMALWLRELQEFMPPGTEFQSARQQTFFGGLYQKLVLIR
jgi:ubiquinone/menaquinone biosynthesis C-methylase UbiE